MRIKDILNYVDHTNLSPAATWDKIRNLCDEAVEYSVASVCVAPTFVRRAKAYLGERMKICTVIGFPNGYNPTKVKVYEARQAILDGADELDMVINLGNVKAGHFDTIEREIALIKKVCGDRILKVIVEACLLTEKEKIELCKVVTRAGADYIKTSTGFSSGGATPEDVALFAKHIGDGVKIKAAGGIRTIEAAKAFIELSCSRIGSSALVNLAKIESAKHDQ